MQVKSDVQTIGIQYSWIPSTLPNVDVYERTYLPKVIAFEAGTAQKFFKAARVFANITLITIPASVEVLCERCFDSCTSLSRVTFAAGSCLKRIEKEAFSGCESLKEIEIPASVEVLCERCFVECKSLSRVTFAAGSCLKRVEKEAFSWCSSLKEIEIPASVEVLCEVALQVCKE